MPTERASESVNRPAITVCVILATLINEPALVAMLAPEGQIMFRGTRTDLHAAGAMTGQMQIMIDFHYLYSPSF